MGYFDGWEDEFGFDNDDYGDDFIPEDPLDRRFEGRPRDSMVVLGHIKYKAGGNPVETTKAILWVLKDGSEHWLAKSQIHQRKDDEYAVINGWLASQKGWIQQEINIEPGAPKPLFDIDEDDEIPF